MKTHTLKALISSLSFASIVLLAGNATAATDKLYHLKGNSMTGSHQPTIEASSPISFSKRFANLTPQEQALFRANYSDLAATDTPPFPRRGLKAVYRPIVKANKNIEASGSLHLTAMVNKNGFVESVKVLNSPNVKLAAVAESALLRTEFDPARCNGVACEMTFPLEIKFN